MPASVEAASLSRSDQDEAPAPDQDVVKAAEALELAKLDRAQVQPAGVPMTPEDIVEAAVASAEATPEKTTEDLATPAQPVLEKSQPDAAQKEAEEAAQQAIAEAQMAALDVSRDSKNVAAHLPAGVWDDLQALDDTATPASSEATSAVDFAADDALRMITGEDEKTPDAEQDDAQAWADRAIADAITAADAVSTKKPQAAKSTPQVSDAYTSILDDTPPHEKEASLLAELTESLAGMGIDASPLVSAKLDVSPSLVEVGSATSSALDDDWLWEHMS
jgi:hypothetical protein